MGDALDKREEITEFEGEKHPGRPLAFKTVEELEVKCDEYFETCWGEVPVLTKQGPVMIDDEEAEPRIITTKSGEEKIVYPKKMLTERKQIRPYTLSGLADYLNVDRRTLLNYGRKDEYFPTIARARRKCEMFSEEQLYIGNDRGAKFGLINNYGWVDKTEQTLTGPNGGPIQLSAVQFDPTRYTDDELDKLEEFLARQKEDKNPPIDV